ncbi:MAG TPA: S16 family serine protease, partial [Thermoanaerobaculia bacterium]|nr:S16 family serine protease [Thermoanaerobaculia bacterium]
LPKMNRRDLEQIPAKILQGVRFEYVETMEEVTRIALLTDDAPPVPAPSPAEGPAPGARPIRITPDRGKPATDRP